MAFVKARKKIGKRLDGNTIKVSQKAYEHLYKNKGYVLVDDDGVQIEEDAHENVIDETDFTESEHVEQEVDEIPISEIPISEMNSTQLKQFAKEHNIDTSSANNVKEARRIIQKAVREGNM